MFHSCYIVLFSFSTSICQLHQRSIVMTRTTSSASPVINSITQKQYANFWPGSWLQNIFGSLSFWILCFSNNRTAKTVSSLWWFPLFERKHPEFSVERILRYAQFYLWSLIVIVRWNSPVSVEDEEWEMNITTRLRYLGYGSWEGGTDGNIKLFEKRHLFLIFL